MGDTWAYDGYNWILKSTSGPHVRANHAIAYDKARQKVVIFGGSYYQTIYSDTWEWNGTNWNQVSTTGPSSRLFLTMAYDEARQKIVLFGGQTHYSGTLLNDTWEWDGVSWEQVATTGPEPRSCDMMTYDPTRQRVILFGGGKWGSSEPLFDDTWEWDGSEWTEIDVSGPSAREAGAMFYDEAMGCIILLGGNTIGGIKGDTWAYTAAPPTPNTIASIAAASATQIDITSTEATDDTPPVYYRLDGQYYNGASWVDSGGGVSDYDYSQTRPNPWSDTVLVANGLYRYRQQVKDSATTPNESAWSAWVEKYTLANTPISADCE